MALTDSLQPLYRPVVKTFMYNNNENSIRYKVKVAHYEGIVLGMLLLR
jgi:hypothetical protein